MDLDKYAKTLRPWQWYKNMLVFLAIIYSFTIFDFNKLALSFFGFVALSILSSANYIFNDIVDKTSDSKNILKKSSPIASGKITINTAFLLILILLAAGFFMSFILSQKFFLLMILFFANSSAYTLFLKKKVLADILAIAANFVIRAVSGALIIDVYVSPWLVLCPFFLSLFISTGKRRAEISTLGKNAATCRNTLSQYTEKIMNSLMIVTTTILIIAYTIYTLTVDIKLLFTLPVVIYGIFRYFYFVYKKPLIAANPEQAFKDKRFMLSLILWFVITLAVLYTNF